MFLVLGFSSFGIVSDFDIRISNFGCGFAGLGRGAEKAKFPTAT